MLETNQEQDPQADSDRRFPLWTILPWTLLAAALLLLLPRVFHSDHAQQVAAAAAQTSPALSQAPPADAPAAVAASTLAGNASPPAAPASAASVPLTVTLSRAGGSRHVPVGKPVMISAYASLPPGESATLAISYGKASGPKTLLALAQGSLSSAAWVPVAPGRYKFTASALDSRKNGAFSRSLFISVDAPPAPVKPAPAPAPVAAVPAVRAAPVRVAAPKPAAPKPHRNLPTPPASSDSSPYRVAAAGFKVKAIAETLAGALRRRGFHAFVRPTAFGRRPKMYQVETGDFVRLKEAQKQVGLLKRDGYPAYQFQSP